jgi:hypothetical protein
MKFKHGKKKADYLRLSGPKEQHSGEFPQYSVWLTYFRYDAKKKKTVN